MVDNPNGDDQSVSSATCAYGKDRIMGIKSKVELMDQGWIKPGFFMSLYIYLRRLGRA